jgi:hypothetical protein
MTHGPADYKKLLGERLGKLMARAGVDKVAMSEVLECSDSKIARIVRGGVGVGPSDLERMLDHLGVNGAERDELRQLGKEASRRRPPTPWGSAVPDALRKYFPTEDTATLIRAYDPELVYGLGQTERYARAVIEANPTHRPADVPRLVQARMARQLRLSGPTPPRLHLVLSEGAIRRVVGGAEVMREQLDHLGRLAERDEVVVQVVPFSVGAHASTGFPFMLFTTAAKPVVAYVENVTDGLFVTEAGRLETYELVWSALVASALSAEDTRALLATVARQL